MRHTYHPSCRARIGSETDGVVDSELRVYGVDGLRVADASVLPVVPHGNTHAPTVMVGETQPTSSVKATERQSI